MAIVNGDAKGLEWVVGTYLSKDKVAYEEIWNNVDQHTLNMAAFGIPSRLIAKKFVFRLMYGGSAYSYANDADFTDTSTSTKYWQGVIDNFYKKYKGFYEWHNNILREVERTGKLVMPTGREYIFDYVRNYKGELVLPQTIIKNYPVQGLGADIMSIARVSFAKRFKKAEIDGIMCNSVHDSIVCDVRNSEVERVVRIFHDVFDDLPANFESIFGVPFDLPMRVEVGVGENMKELTEWKLVA
jgi:DNA polymerase I-like protein with 3'-5' exonuclease and polymerase domains